MIQRGKNLFTEGEDKIEGGRQNKQKRGWVNEARKNVLNKLSLQFIFNLLFQQLEVQIHNGRQKKYYK